MKRLERFFTYRRPRAKVILYLLADGFTVNDIVLITCKVLDILEMHDAMGIYVEEIVNEGKPDDPAFRFPSGEPYKAPDIYKVVRQATKQLVDKPLKVTEFAEYVHE